MANWFQDLWDNLFGWLEGRVPGVDNSGGPLGPELLSRLSDDGSNSSYLSGTTPDQRNKIEDFIGKGDYLGLQGYLSQYGISLGADFEKWLDNMISQQNTSAQWEYEKQMRDSQILSSANQYSSLGMNAASMLSGLASSNSLNTAENVKSNVALQKSQQKLEMTKAVLSMIASMGAAGIHGSALGIARHAASGMASRAATSMSQSMADLEAENVRFKHAMYRLGAQMTASKWDH